MVVYLANNWKIVLALQEFVLTLLKCVRYLRCPAARNAHARIVLHRPFIAVAEGRQSLAEARKQAAEKAAQVAAQEAARLARAARLSKSKSRPAVKAK